MAYTYNATLLLGSSQTGLAATLRAALMDTTGTVHATLRDISTGFVEVGSGIYSWVYDSVPDGYRGAVVYYIGTLGVAANFVGVTLKTASPVDGLSTLSVADIPTTAEAADALLGRNLAGGSDGGRTVRDALRALRNRVSRPVEDGTLTVYAEDDLTPAWTAAATTSGEAVPITEVDPS